MREPGQNQVQSRSVPAYPRLVTSSEVDLAALGWDEAWQLAAAPFTELGVAGRVVRVDRGLVTVVTAGGSVRASLGADLLEAMAADTLAAPCTGDWGIVRHWPDGPLTVEALLPRRTAITRAEASRRSRGQVLAANVDLAAVVVALHPEPNLGRVERLLALAWESGARPVVVLAKQDLANDSDLLADEVARLAPGVDVMCTSTVRGSGIDLLRSRLDGRLTLGMLGVSGHGKSSLANALAGADLLATKRIRDDGKGRHTTVRRELVVLPTGGAVIDTPGLRGIGLLEGGAGLAATFPDLEELVRGCRFSDCGHETEPGCAVQAAIDTGELSMRRLDSWRRLQRERQFMAARTDARLRAELAQRGKHLSKQARANARHRT